jgi:hypothetical protein
VAAGQPRWRSHRTTAPDHPATAAVAAGHPVPWAMVQPPSSAASPVTGTRRTCAKPTTNALVVGPAASSTGRAGGAGQVVTIIGSSLVGSQTARTLGAGAPGSRR